MSSRPPRLPTERRLGDAPAESDTAPDGTLRLRLKAIETDHPPPSFASTPFERQALQTSRQPSAPPQTLTAFDWLDTVVDEMLVASDRVVDEPSAAATFSTAPRVMGRPSGIERVEPQVSDSAILGQVVLGYSPMIDRNRAVIATRLTVVPVRPAMPLDAGALLRTLGEVWPSGGGAVSLNVSSEHLLSDLLRAEPTKNVMIEVPAFLAGEPSNARPLLELAARGNTLLLKGRPLRELPAEVLPCFRWSIIDLADDRRAGTGRPPADVRRGIPHVQSGVRTMAQLNECFERGAVAVLGWPIHDPIDREPRPDLQVAVEMINRIDRAEPVEALEHTLTRDPALAYELMRYLNTQAFGLQVETGSFRHAIMMLGYRDLRRWLALQLAHAGDDSHARPVNYAAMRRGLLMRELAPAGSDEETRSELFMCGVFSLLHRVFGKPVGELLQTLLVPERVRQALVDQAGSLFPMLELARAVESELPQEIRAAADAVFVRPAEINRALLRTLAVAFRSE